MAYEKLKKLNQPQKINWNQAKLVDILFDDNNKEYFQHKDTGERFFKVYFHFTNQDDEWIIKEFPYCNSYLWGEKTAKERCEECLSACKLKTDFSDINDIYTQEKFVSVSGSIELDNNGYPDYKVFINPMRTQKSAKEVNPIDLLNKLNNLNKDTVVVSQYTQPTQTQSNPVDNDDVPDDFKAVENNSFDENGDIPF